MGGRAAALECAGATAALGLTVWLLARTLHPFVLRRVAGIAVPDGKSTEIVLTAAEAIGSKRRHARAQGPLQRED